MTRTTTASLLVAALVAGTPGCGKDQPAEKEAPAKQEPAAPPPAAKAPSAEPGAPAAANPPAAGGDVAPEAATAPAVPTEQDFEAKAKADVDAKNLEAEVGKMEKELGVK